MCFFRTVLLNDEFVPWQVKLNAFHCMAHTHTRSLSIVSFHYQLSYQWILLFRIVIRSVYWATVSESFPHAPLLCLLTTYHRSGGPDNHLSYTWSVKSNHKQNQNAEQLRGQVFGLQWGIHGALVISSRLFDRLKENTGRAQYCCAKYCAGIHNLSPCIVCRMPIRSLQSLGHNVLVKSEYRFDIFKPFQDQLFPLIKTPLS